MGFLHISPLAQSSQSIIGIMKILVQIQKGERTTFLIFHSKKNYISQSNL
nr:MAG TPA: hypothetical protein [Crassvirales sp.]